MLCREAQPRRRWLAPQIDPSVETIVNRIGAAYKRMLLDGLTTTDKRNLNALLRKLVGSLESGLA